MASSFERDFGYLLPFLDRVTQAASDHPDARVRAELLSLLADEKARWTRVRELMSARPGRARADALGDTFNGKRRGKGAPTPSDRDFTGPTETASPAPPSDVSAASTPSSIPAATYTVGPLRSGR